VSGHKNANHTMMMNFMVYGVGLCFAYWFDWFCDSDGGRRRGREISVVPLRLNAEHVITLFGKPFGIFGQSGLFLVHRGTYDVRRHGAFSIPNGIHGHHYGRFVTGFGL